MSPAVFLNRIILINYKSIGYCDVTLGPLTYLVGSNGAGKSNFLDALHFVRDALDGSLDNALNERGGVSEVRRISLGHPKHFMIRLEFNLPDGRKGHYGFEIGALQDRGYVVDNESCVIEGNDQDTCYHIVQGVVQQSSENTFPSITPDRLALVAASGLTSFRPVYDALVSMNFTNLNPKLMRELQKPQDGRLLKPAGENIASVIGHLERLRPDRLETIREYLQNVVPLVQSVERKQVGPMETLEFRQSTGVSNDPWRFLAQNMSDGTLRALGVLVALFQGNQDFAPTLIGIEEPETALHPAASAALRDAVNRASKNTQIIVTSHSPDFLDASEISSDSILAFVSIAGETRIATLENSCRQAIRYQLFTVGELLRLNQLEPDSQVLKKQEQNQAHLLDHLQP